MIVIQADEHVPQDVVTGLNARGIEAYSAYHEDLSGASDREVFENNVFYLVAGLLKVCASFYPRAKRLCGPGRVVERHPNRGRQRVARALRLNCGGAPVVTNPTDQLPPRT